MSDLGMLVSEDYLDFSIKTESYKKKENDHSEKKFKFIKVVFCVLCFALLAEFVIYRYVIPCFSSPKVTVTGHNIYTAEEIATKLLPMNSANWFDFDVNQAAAILSSESGIENVVVEKKFPDRISVKIVEREPVAVTFVVENGCSSPIQIDKNGVLFPGKTGADVDTASVPIISGLPVEYMSSGMRIPSKYRPLIEEINKIRSLPQKYFASISEICVLPKEYGSYELALIPAQSKVKVLTDRALNEDALKYMMVVLDVVNQLGTDVSEVDLRYGSVSYRTK